MPCIIFGVANMVCIQKIGIYPSRDKATKGLRTDTEFSNSYLL